jgi:hypothetical protein
VRQVHGEEMSMCKCDKCGEEFSIGDWPYCPHQPTTHFGENPMEPYIDDQIGPDPVEFRTIGEKVRYMDAHGLVPFEHKNHRNVNRRIFLDMGK